MYFAESHINDELGYCLGTYCKSTYIEFSKTRKYDYTTCSMQNFLLQILEYFSYSQNLQTKQHFEFTGPARFLTPLLCAPIPLLPSHYSKISLKKGYFLSDTLILRMSLPMKLLL